MSYRVLTHEQRLAMIASGGTASFLSWLEAASHSSLPMCERVSELVMPEVAIHGNVAMFQALLERGVDINSPHTWFPELMQGYSTEGWTPLLYATFGGNLKTVIWLLEAGANINACSSEGITALHIAAYQNYADIARHLLDAGANINAADNNDETPLALASGVFSFDVSRLLEERGADA